MEPLDWGNALLINQCLRQDRCASQYRATLGQLWRQWPMYHEMARELLQLHARTRNADTMRRADETSTAAAWIAMSDFMERRRSAVAAYLKTVVTGEVRWTPTTSRLAKGSPLTAEHLNAYSDIPGAFVYSKPIGTRLPTGRTALTVTFTPTDRTRPAQTVTREFTVG